MRFVQFSVRPVLTALCLAWAAAGAAAQTTVDLYPLNDPLKPDLGFATPPSVSTTGTAKSITFNQTATVDGFNADTGVLTGVSGMLDVNALTRSTSGMQLGFPEKNLAGITSTGSLSTVWSVGGSTLNASLISLSGTKDATFGSDAHWNAPTTTALVSGATSADLARLDQFVGASVNTSLVSILSIASANDGTAKSVAMVNSANRGVTSTLVDLSLSFDYLAHSQATLNNDFETYLGESKLSVGIEIYNQFGANGRDSTGLDFAGESAIVCENVTAGACDHFTFTLDPTTFTNVLAGDLITLGTVAVKGELGNHEAHYTLTFWDNANTGALATRRSSSVDFVIESGVTAVPEPHSAALLLAGLGAIGWMSRRRRAGERQVAKL